MSWPRKFCQKYYEFFMGQCDQHAIVLMRILLGSSLFLAYLFRWQDVLFFWGPDSVAHFHEQAGFSENPLSHSLGHVLLTNKSEFFVYALWALTLVSTFCFTIGYKTIRMGLVALLLHMIFVHHLSEAFWGWGKSINSF